ncbi:aminotransferase class I/II-fold pyridoxal phosphate-dependent enzyme [Saccharolobus caldissimus]|uniref:Aminotransferase n=1 Tax=Saccharolobus caldissimus TaxID=1702097 RepID=A0AAQ4CQG5_9CREN|nr:aminotransferase class I/II-fold pyridoxal phosphate-dependent enzyme [Saccharolobus caldissimus]BDB98046.1 aminotransferase [Saccharolobus caldissimus]
MYPEFCLERWQSLRDWRAKFVLSESGVEPLSLSNIEIKDVKLEYGHTKGIIKLRELISQLYEDRNEENVIITNGGAEANYITILSLIKPNDEVVVEMPNYMQIPGLLKGIGAKVKYVWLKEENSFKLDLNELNEKVSRNTKAIVITNPNNPTGMALSESEIKGIVEIAEDNNSLIIADEVYRGSEIDGNTRKSFVDLYQNAISTNSMSKVYGMPGIRIGWIVGNKELIDRMWSIRDYITISPSIVSQEIAYKALNKREELINRAKNIAINNFRLFERLISSYDNVKWIRPNATVLAFIKLLNIKNTFDFSERLFEKYSVLVNPGECFEMPGYIRIGLGSANSQYLNQAISLLLKHLNEYNK